MQMGKRSTLLQGRSWGLSAVGIRAEHLEMEGEAESPGGTMYRRLQGSTTVQGGKSLAGGGGDWEGQRRAVGT